MAGVPPPVAALLLQVAAFLIALACAALARRSGYAVTPMPFAFLCGFIAALLSRWSGLASWWLPIQLFFLPALVWAQSLDLPPGWFLAAFLVMLAIYWSTFRTQVPLYLSSRKAWRALETLLPAASPGKDFSFMDLGSGMGGMLLYLANTRPDGRYYGVESAPLPFLASWLRIALGGARNCRVRWGSLWSCDLAQYDVVFAYLSPVPMERLWLKAKIEMRPGTLFVSNTFAVPGHPPQNAIALDDLHRSTLYVWRM
ncbi:MAG: class I SAM-dependent methyltransferase [Nitrosomonadales bacterium]|nr:class I SAM-dependent methyltransferase [Nitrosomonadales bacterium]